MTGSERIDQLVYLLEGGRAKEFTEKTGIAPACLSRVRHGQGNPETYYSRILAAYPQIRKQWMYSGIGEPLKEKDEKGEILRKVDALEREVKRLAGLIEKLTGG